MSEKMRNIFWFLIVGGVLFTVYSIEHSDDIVVPHTFKTTVNPDYVIKVPGNTSYGTETPDNLDCDAAIETLRKIDEAQISRNESAEDDEYKRMTSASRQGDAALSKEVDREEIADSMRDVAQRREREPASERVSKACHTTK